MSRAPGGPVSQSSFQADSLLEKLLRTDSISVTLKFGFQQKPFKYSANDVSNSIIEKIYRDAESWIRSIATNSKSLSLVDRYTLYLFRIPTTDLTMIPVAQVSDIEHNCLIELVVVPVEINQNPHALYRCQLNVPTNCSKCSRLITGIYRQGFRCRKCRMTYHKDCAPFLLDDCSVSVPADPPSPTRKSTVSFVNPFVAAPTNSTSTPDNPTVPIYSPSSNTAKENEQSVESTTIIDEGIFPACINGTDIYRRYLFLLTPNSLKLTTNLSAISSPHKQQARQTADIETVLPLADISNLVLTHFMDDRNHVFEIHFHGKFILCVGKKSDSDDLQMQTAQFYSSIRDQWESNTSSTSTAQPAPAPTTTTTPSSKPTGDLRRKRSIYRRPPYGRDNEDKDLHELYGFTGEKIGEGNQRALFLEKNALLCLSGQFGRVVGAVRKSTNRKVAIKCIEKANCSEEDIRRTNEEIDHLYKFNHVNTHTSSVFFCKKEIGRAHV